MLESIINRFKEKVNIILRYGLLLVAVLLIISLIRNIIRIGKANEKIGETRQKVARLRQENEQLKDQVEAIQNDYFVEKTARDKLGLAKEGEIVLVLPEEELLKRISPVVEEEEDALPDPNWKKWLKLFL